jgi:hypothetical protein
VEQAWGLAALTTNDGNASAMTDFFGGGTTTVPGAPTNVTATAGRRSATVNWSASASNGCAITGYTVTASPGGSTITTGGTTTSATIKGLKAGVAYTFTVTATNCIGTSPPSAPSNSVTPTH